MSDDTPEPDGTTFATELWAACEKLGIELGTAKYALLIALEPIYKREQARLAATPPDTAQDLEMRARDVLFGVVYGFVDPGGPLRDSDARRVAGILAALDAVRREEREVLEEVRFKTFDVSLNKPAHRVILGLIDALRTPKAKP